MRGRVKGGGVCKSLTYRNLAFVCLRKLGRDMRSRMLKFEIDLLESLYGTAFMSFSNALVSLPSKLL